LSDVSRSAEAAPPSLPEVSVGALFFAFLRLGSVSFGGSSAGWIYRDIVQRRAWVSDPEFLALMAVGQSLPGANGVKLSVLVGRQLRGGVGAFTAPFAFLLGPFVIILAVGAIYGRVSHYSILHAVLDGVAAAVVGLTLSTGISAVARGAADRFAIAMSGVTVLCVGILGWPMLPVILVLAPISIGMTLFRSRQA
jgi:chromate transporter